jgi:hypothetical protein
VIHGAGTIEDKLIKDKTLESFERVLSTKVDSLITLAAHVHPASLRYLAIFSSISARMGNRGQADYAAASEVLNKLALELDRQWPATRVVSFNWGPWLATGMVSPEVQRQFAARGVQLIPIDQGCAALIDELRLGQPGEVEVVIGGWSEHRPRPASMMADLAEEHPLLPLLARSAKVIRTPTGVEVERTMSLRTDRYLGDHRVDGRPVVPLAVALELVAEAAVAAVPGQTVRAVHQLRLLKGVVLEQDREVKLRVVAEPRPNAAGTQVDVVVTAVDGPPVRHYEALVELGPAASPAPLVQPPAPMRAGEWAELPIEHAYTNILFHGPLLQAIEAIPAIGPSGAQAILRPSAPSHIVTGANEREEWLMDPVLVDAAIQLQLVWARHHWDVTSLPSTIHAYTPMNAVRGRSPRAAARDLRESDRAPVVRCEMRVRATSEAPISHADFFFFAPDGQLLAHLEDLEMVGSAGLNRVVGGRSASV